MRLFRAEIERALRRRIVRTLVAIACAGSAVLGLIAFFDSRDIDVAHVRATNDPHPAIMTDWWTPGQDSILLTGAIFLAMGALIGGASMFGADWRAGTLPTLLVWEPRRLRVGAARLGACVLCAAGIAIVLQAILLTALLPAVLVNGTTDGATAEWWMALAAAVGRIASLAAVAAALAGSIALVARNTAAAIIVPWIWLAIVESTVRGVKPWASRYLITDSIARFVSWTDVGGGGRSPGMAFVQLLLYVGLLVAGSVWWFQRSDAVVG